MSKPLKQEISELFFFSSSVNYVSTRSEDEILIYKMNFKKNEKVFAKNSSTNMAKDRPRPLFTANPSIHPIPV